jgi:hypothetical protein
LYDGAVTDFRFHLRVVELDIPNIFPTLRIEALFLFETLISISKTARCHTINLSTGYHRNEYYDLGRDTVWSDTIKDV